MYDLRDEEEGGFGASRDYSSPNYRRREPNMDFSTFFDEEERMLNEMHQRFERERRERERGRDEEMCNLDSGYGAIGQTLTCLIDTLSCTTTVGVTIATAKYHKLKGLLGALNETTTPTYCEFAQYLIAHSDIVFCAIVGGLSCVALKFLLTQNCHSVPASVCRNYFLGIERCGGIQNPDMDRGALKNKNKNTKKKRKYKKRKRSSRKRKSKKQTANKLIKKKRKSKINKSKRRRNSK